MTFQNGDEVMIRSGEMLIIDKVIPNVGPLKKTLYTFRDYNDDFRLSHDELIMNSLYKAKMYDHLWTVKTEEDYWHFVDNLSESKQITTH